MQSSGKAGQCAAEPSNSTEAGNFQQKSGLEANFVVTKDLAFEVSHLPLPKNEHEIRMNTNSLL